MNNRPIPPYMTPWPTTPARNPSIWEMHKQKEEMRKQIAESDAWYKASGQHAFLTNKHSFVLHLQKVERDINAWYSAHNIPRPPSPEPK